MTVFEQDERFARLNLLVESAGMSTLENATVMVVGLGGVGSSCAQTLARGGVGKLIILDGDVVSSSNINRQLLAFDSTVGRPKAEVMKELILDINPNCQVYAVEEFVKAQNIAPLLRSLPRPDYVIDCIDSFYAKTALIQWCIEQQVPLLSSMGAANRLDPSLLSFSYIEDTSYCKMSKTMRHICAELGIKKLEVLYSKEKQAKIKSYGSVKKEHTLGSISYMPPIMGMLLASKVLRRLLGLESYKLTPIMKGQK
ncbi:tRNA threonylcarbamoyladenosine dehydratase [Aerococcaceae bacterium zg-ZUI334]|uniref:tRNA threonylcarbamoyladenosine dehydratase n=1 Tax=Aerococcaceae bacterium zg-252 TaxID=2796928 RepID=UPI001BA42CBC|nr:tRNA threonylcarbamoyladenosine dehydratase [Aerococcaceae bacterium zg-ZUI334]